MIDNVMRIDNRVLNLEDRVSRFHVLGKYILIYSTGKSTDNYKNRD